jgi:hypothetical protein
MRPEVLRKASPFYGPLPSDASRVSRPSVIQVTTGAPPLTANEQSGLPPREMFMGNPLRGSGWPHHQRWRDFAVGPGTPDTCGCPGIPGGVDRGGSLHAGSLDFAPGGALSRPSLPAQEPSRVPPSPGKAPPDLPAFLFGFARQGRTPTTASRDPRRPVNLADQLAAKYRHHRRPRTLTAGAFTIPIGWIEAFAVTAATPKPCRRSAPDAQNPAPSLLQVRRQRPAASS